MIILAAALASAPALPWIDRAWLAEQVRREAVASGSPKRPLKLAPSSRPAAPASTAPVNSSRKLMSFENTIGM